MKKAWVVLGVLIGVLALLVGVWALVMFGPPRYSQVVSKPEFCARCHEMDPQYTRFKVGAHGKLKSCNECHLPNETFAGHWFWDSVVGARDLALHTIGAIPESDTLAATGQSKRWIRKNCLDCHEDEIEAGHGQEKEYCWDCHEDVYHAPDTGAENQPDILPYHEKEEVPTYYVRADE